MEIYYDKPSIADTATTPGRKSVVSFAPTQNGNNKLAGEYTPGPHRSGRKPLGAHNYQGTPHSKKSMSASTGKVLSGRQNISSATKKTPLRSTTPMDKENSSAGLGFFTSSMSPPLTGSSHGSTNSRRGGGTPNSAQAFRRALRGQSNPPKEETLGHIHSNRLSSLGGGQRLGGLGPPLRMAPKTPNSLLQAELEGGSDEEEESLLVSPSGALWNVLGTKTHPNSASSTGLLIVPPKTAESIQRLSSQKKAATDAIKGDPHMHLATKTTDWKSPTLQSRSQVRQQTIADGNNDSSVFTSPEVVVKGKGKGVAMDLSSMFSTEKTMKPAESSKQSKVEQKVPLQKGEEDKKQGIFWTLETGSPRVPSPAPAKLTSPKATNKTSPIETEKAGKGLSMDMTAMFSASKSSQKTKATPPPHLLKRLQEPVSRKSRQDTVVTSTMKKASTLGKKNPIVPKMSQSAAMEQSQTGSSAKGPPAHLLKRLEKRTLQEYQAAGGKASLSKPPRQMASKPVTSRKQSKEDASSKKRPISVGKQNRSKENTKAKHTPTKKGDSTKNLSNQVAGKVSTPGKKLTVKKHESPVKPTRAAEDWAGKQCDTFLEWLNYTFHPTEDDDHAADTMSSRSGLRALVIHRRLAQVRFRASELFQSQDMRRIRTTVQNEIAKGKLTIRSDRDLYADLSLRKQAIKLLLSYTTPWLRLGLEVMFGECIMPENLQEGVVDDMTPVARMRATLKDFVVERVLSDQNVLMKYTKGKTKVPSGKFEKLFREEMRTLILYRLMVLILFLDKAKTQNILEKAPRLFAKSSDVKSSKAVLQSFCRNFLSAEGDFIKHLSRIGIQVSYKQDPIDELEFNVQNLASDLRDGTRLTRLTEITTGASFKSVMRSLRLPVVSRLQKIFNVDVAMSRLRDHEIFIPSDVKAHHIVDAHREMVLKLMWSIVAHSCMTKLLEGGHVEEEIENVLRSNQARRRVQGLRIRSPEKFSPLKDDQTKQSPEEIVKTLLFRWAKAVCAHFGLELADFTTSFADGRALCYLVHYYHPAVIQLKEIKPTNAGDDEGLSEDQALLNQRSNSAMVAKRVTELGGIPKMLPVTDVQNPPDEKSMLLCLSYLCSRLMESSKEIFATILIQASYRRYREKVLLEKKEAAALEIFKFWCKNKHVYYAALERRYTAAVRVLEQFVLSHKPALAQIRAEREERERCESAALRIQSLYRGYLGRIQYSHLQERVQGATVIQQYFRRFKAQIDVLEMLEEKDCAICIQKAWRSFLCQKRMRNTIKAVVKIQCIVRGLLVRHSLDNQHYAAMLIQQAWWTYVDYNDSQVAAILIQARWRAYSAQKAFRDLHEQNVSAQVIQKTWRSYNQERQFNSIREGVISIQSIVRGYQARRLNFFKRQQAAATQIQKLWRGFSSQVAYQMDLMDITVVQSMARVRLAKHAALKRREALTVLQLAFRCALARRHLIMLYDEKIAETRRLNAAVVLQSAMRSFLSVKQLRLLRQKYESAVSIQRHWRGYKWKSIFRKQVAAATIIQSLHRCTKAKAEWRAKTDQVKLIQARFRFYLHRKNQNQSAAAIQATWRMSRTRACYQEARSSAIVIQKQHRRIAARSSFLEQKEASVRIQAAWRGFWAKYNYDLDLLEIVISQSIVRRMLAQRQTQERKNAIRKLQNFFRVCKAVHTVESLRQAKADFIEKENSSVLLQSIARRFIAQSLLRRQSLAATLIQSSIRATIKRKAYQKQRNQITSVQALYRGYRSRMTLLERNVMATAIQAAWRGHIWSKRYELDYASVVTIQSLARRSIAAREASRRRRAVIAMQSMIRMKLARVQASEIRAALTKERLENEAATLLQSLYRGRSVRADLKFKNGRAALIQSVCRGWMARVLYTLDRCDIMICQSIVRRWKVAREVKARKIAIVAIQAGARVMLAKNVLRCLQTKRNVELLENRSAVAVQAAYRGYVIRRNFGVLHRMATRIQAAFRGHYHHVVFQMYIVDVISVQALVRRWLVKKQQQREGVSAVLIQTRVRILIARNRAQRLLARKQLLDLREVSAVKVQSLWRSFVARKTVSRHAAARQIQKTWRCFSIHVDYLVKQIMIIRLQAKVRAFLQRAAFLRAVAGITALQGLVRGVEQRRQNAFFDTAAVLIQSYFRRHVARDAFLAKKEAVLVLQRVVRGTQARDDLQLAHFAASEIQRAWRGFAQFCDYVVTMDSTVRLQAFFRMVKTRRVYEAYKLKLYVEHRFVLSKVRHIQRAYRRHMFLKRLHLSALCIQGLARRYIQRRRATVVARGVTALQARFRGRKARRRRSKKILQLAKRVKIANRKARENPKLRIGYKTRHALEVLQTSNSLSDIMDAVNSLEATTRLSQLCCVLFTEANAARILLDLTRSCNRSVPHMELVHCILLTLDNVGRFRQLVPSFADCDSAAIFLDKMLMFRNEDGIFCLTVSLLGKISACNPAIAEYCAMREPLKRLKGLYDISVKLHKGRARASQKPSRRKVNRMKRREDFDRGLAIRSLGQLTDSFARHSIRTPVANHETGVRHFTFDRRH